MNTYCSLGVNIDHIATLREARGTRYPEPVQAALMAEEAGADSITLHPREDERHIKPRDVRLVRAVMNTPMNLEMAVTERMIELALEVAPEHICLVPERREELTTEGGLDVAGFQELVTDAVKTLQSDNCTVSLFIDPDRAQIDAALKTGARAVEIHTGRYADATTREARHHELIQISNAAKYAHECNLIVNAGHGLHYHNVAAIAALPEIRTLNIGHSIMSRAFFTGLAAAVREMKLLLKRPI